MTTETTIERVPWQQPEPGSPSYNKPTWRLVAWRDNKIVEVAESSSLRVLTARTPWAIEPYATEVDKAIRALGRANVDGRKHDRDGNNIRFNIYSNRFEAYDRTTGDIKIWDRATGAWQAK